MCSCATELILGIRMQRPLSLKRQPWISLFRHLAASIGLSPEAPSQGPIPRPLASWRLCIQVKGRRWVRLSLQLHAVVPLLVLLLVLPLLPAPGRRRSWSSATTRTTTSRYRLCHASLRLIKYVEDGSRGSGCIPLQTPTILPFLPNGLECGNHPSISYVLHV